MVRSVNPPNELTKLAALFSRGEKLVEHANQIPPSATPEPYRQLLVHEQHMTLMMEQFHQTSIDVHVREVRIEEHTYCRKILLQRSDTGAPVQLGIVRIDMNSLPGVVREEIVAGQLPLGRVLINHHVRRRIELRTILEITAARELAELLHMREGEITYGRTATIFCHHAPAVELLEVLAPLPTP